MPVGEYPGHACICQIIRSISGNKNGPDRNPARLKSNILMNNRGKSTGK
jgi:hypothetical protein